MDITRVKALKRRIKEFYKDTNSELPVLVQRDEDGYFVDIGGSVFTGGSPADMLRLIADMIEAEGC